MLRLTTFIVALLLCQALATNSQQGDVQDVVNYNNAFSPSLYGALKSEEGNLVVSTFNVFTEMSLIWTGAGGDTAQQLQSSLHLPASVAHVETGFRSLLSSLQRSDDITLAVDNKLYLQQGFQINDTFRQNVVDNFHSAVDVVNFMNETEAARTTINLWVEDKTHNKTIILIPPGTLSRDSLLLGVNVINFHGWWKEPFPENSTRVDTFHLTSTYRVNVSMMHNIDNFDIKEVDELNLKALRLRYRHFVDGQQVDSVSMVILLPNEIDGLPQLESRIASVNITNIIQQMVYTLANVSLPRFKIDQARRLKDPLKELGIRKVFQGGADLSGITYTTVLISKVEQNAFVQVNEDGTNAASVTDNVVQMSSLRVNENGTNVASATDFDLPVRTIRDPAVNFIADHPFLFYILDNVSGAILFMGRVENPNQL